MPTTKGRAKVKKNMPVVNHKVIKFQHLKV